jgi:hypothetical protein
MATMQDHPIDMICAQLAQVGKGAGQGVLGLLMGLALIGGLWASTLRPADAAGPSALPPVFAAPFTASASIGGHLGVTPLRLDGSVLAQTGVLATSLSVCRLVIDPAAQLPLPATCATQITD